MTYAWVAIIGGGFLFTATGSAIVISIWRVRKKQSPDPNHNAIYNTVVSNVVQWGCLLSVPWIISGIVAMQPRPIETSANLPPKLQHPSTDAAPSTPDPRTMKGRVEHAMEMKVTTSNGLSAAGGGSVKLEHGESYTFSWSAPSSHACLLSPSNAGLGPSGVITSGSLTVASGDPLYPTAEKPVTLSITCTDGTSTGSKSVVVSLASNTRRSLGVSIMANNSYGTITLKRGETYFYSWTSTMALSCQLTSPSNSGIPIAGLSATIGPGDSFYPKPGGSVTLSVICTDDIKTVTAAVTIKSGEG